MTLIDKACYERGCACYDSRVDRDGVEVVQRTWVGLTDEEIEDIWADCPIDWDDKINILTFARAIEAAHGIKENV